METALFCPFTAGTVTWQAQDGSWTLTVCVRGTFSLVHGREAVLADAQEPIAGDRHYAEDPRQSLYAASDLVPYKPRTDVILVGSAFAADKEPVEALVARVSVGELDKSVGVIGDRRWVEGPDGLEPGLPSPFTSMPLRHERAARAPDNPLGFDLTRPPALGALALPNLEAVDDGAAASLAVGFGPLPQGAASRRSLLSAEGLAWASRGAAGPVPAGFDFAFYNAAPRDQQIGLLRNRTTLVLENLHREHARLEVRLPSVRPKAFLVSRDADRGAEVALRCDTLWIDTDRAVMALSWRGLIGLESAETRGLDMLLVATEARGRELRFKHIQRLLREGVSVSLDEDPLGETNPLGIRHDAVKERRAPPQPAAPAKESEPGWEELSNADLMEMTLGDELTPLAIPGAFPSSRSPADLAASSQRIVDEPTEPTDMEMTIPDYDMPADEPQNMPADGPSSEEAGS